MLLWAANFELVFELLAALQVVLIGGASQGERPPQRGDPKIQFREIRRYFRILAKPDNAFFSSPPGRRNQSRASAFFLPGLPGR